ncbi:MAG TPA: hypothetical protein VKV80_13400 [Streptosporangiaceae bacterium]|nr:hypothetical protein [Streptosporangiaceae bacterium]
MRAEGIRRGAGHVGQLTLIGDGAAWIWHLTAAAFPGATCIAGLCHAREHLHSLPRSLGCCSAAARTNGSPPAPTTSATATRHRLNPPPSDGGERQHWFRSRGLFTGSGVAGAGCTTVIGQRLKQAGSH